MRITHDVKSRAGISFAALTRMTRLEPRKLILQSHLALGDIVMLTAAVRDLHRHCPGGFLTDVRTGFPELWLHNPYVTPLEQFDSKVETLGCDTLFIAQSGRGPCHYIYNFIDFLNRRLNLGIQPSEFAGDIHLSDAERAAPPPIKELTGKDVPYWIICAGGKFDITIKWWAAERYQEVVDHFRGRIQFIQVGQAGNHHPRLGGVMDLRGRTDLRQLIRLIHHADGVLCGVTSLMHLAAAVPRPPNRPGLRPCVVVAGGREPPHWEAYPGHQFIHTMGALECCRVAGCWKSRTRALGDGTQDDDPEKRCLNVVGTLPRCMDLISAQEVIRRLETYVQGGAARYLRPGELRAARKAMRIAGPSDFEDLPLTLSSARPALEAFLSNPQAPFKSYAGRGIIICGGGARYFANAWVCVNTLRRLGCHLPVQLWHMGSQELDQAMSKLITPLNVRCVDALKLSRKHPVRRLGGWELKAYALLFSDFREVLLLDADNVPVRDPAFLFECKEYKSSGALFWPDFGRSHRSDPVWRSSDVEIPPEAEIESGQLLVEKRRCWPALRLALWFNENSDFYYQHLHGDKDTFAIAFRRLGVSYRLVPHPPESFPGGMYQHDFEGRRLFQHRTVAKWTLMPHNLRVPGFEHEDRCLADLERLRGCWDGRTGWLHQQFPHLAHSRAGNSHTNGKPPEVAAWLITCPERKQALKATLKSLAGTDWADLPLRVLMDNEELPDRVDRIKRQVLQVLRQFMDSRADCLFLLEDDLNFNRHLRYNVERWRPFRNRELTLASLYNPGFYELAFDVPGHAVAVEPSAVYGGQALLLSRRAAAHALSRWNTLENPADVRLITLAAQLGRPIYYHCPSLVQHQDVPSTWGGIAHQARDFEPEWRHPCPLSVAS